MRMSCSATVIRCFAALALACGLGGPPCRATEADPTFEHRLYGDFAAHSTNLYLDSYHYHAVSGWVESVILVGSPARARHPRPYLRTTLLTSAHALPWENMGIWGPGVEWRPLSGNRRLGEHRSLDWTTSLRFYCEYLNAAYLKEHGFSPTHDFRVGVDLWKEYHVDPTRRALEGPYEYRHRWAEVYGNLAWQKTNFYLTDYRGLVFAVNTRAGVRAPRLQRDTYLMPYLMGEVTSAERSYFWQNRALAGAGVRVMPFQHSPSQYVNKTKFYVEYVIVAAYLKDRPGAGIPRQDWRVGVSFSKNRY